MTYIRKETEYLYNCKTTTQTHLWELSINDLDDKIGYFNYLRKKQRIEFLKELNIF